LNNINPPRSYLFPSNSTVKLLQAEIAPTARSVDRKTRGIKRFAGGALVWSDRQVYVTDCDPQTGKPLSEKEVKNAIVTYKYSDHPAKILSNDPMNRYHVMATLDRDGTGGSSLPHYLGFRSR